MQQLIRHTCSTKYDIGKNESGNAIEDASMSWRRRRRRMAKRVRPLAAGAARLVGSGVGLSRRCPPRLVGSMGGNYIMVGEC